MRRYLLPEEAIAYLNLGKAIEQWITTEPLDDSTVIYWLTIDKQTDGSFAVTYFQSIDEGDLDFLDVYSFSQVDPALPNLLSVFPSAQAAIEHAVKSFNCKQDRFMNSGMIQDEYKQFLLKKLSS